LFDSLASLQTLVLSGNRLKYVRKEWFKDLSNLYRLDLSYNPFGETKIC
jgi:Leucine-rich repeat (LRR) protein